MKKHQLSSPARPSVKELTELFERSAAGAFTSKSPSMKGAPLKPPHTNRGSVKAATKLDYAEQPPHTKRGLEQSAEDASTSRSPSIKVAPLKPPRANRGSVKAATKLDYAEQPPHTKRGLEQSAEGASTSRSPSIKVAPPKPPHANRDSVKAATKLDYVGQPPHTKRGLEQSAEGASTSRSPSMKVAPPKPPRVNRGSVKAATKLDYAEQPPHTKRGLEQSSATSFTSSASQSTTVSLSEEQVILLSSHHSLVKVYKQEVQRLCKNVYGNEDALHNQMEEIQKSPMKESNLPWILLNHPQSIAKLSGSTTCGVKNSARRRAEESVSSLSGTMECYLQAIKYAQKSLSESPGTELQYYQRTLGSETLAKILKSPHHPTPEKVTPSEENIANIARRSSTVTRHEEQIQHWCSIVFGKKNLLNEEIKGILKDTSQGEQLVQNLENNPTSFHKLRGRDVCGIKSRARVRAENGLEHLCTAIENYTNNVKQIREHVMQTHQTQHTRHEQSAGLDKNLQNKQTLSQSFKETEQQRKPEARSCKSTTQKSLSFAS
ncbi:hypothetical protein ABID39_001590 [Bartonella japonica]|uniref:Uncharacterized protein n=1 Tax=Bartonella japonica TaxID=357761 RepID=A0ABV2FQM6_9HYPH